MILLNPSVSRAESIIAYVHRYIHPVTVHSTISWMERAFKGVSNLFVRPES